VSQALRPKKGLISQEIVEAAFFNIGNDREARFAGLLHSDNDNLIAEILTHLMDLFHHRVKVGGVLAVPCSTTAAEPGSV